MAGKVLDQGGAWVMAFLGASGMFAMAGSALYYTNFSLGSSPGELHAKAAPAAVPTIDTSVQKGEHPDWNYEGDSGPARWGGLHADWQACSVGAKQSPVDFQEVGLSPAPMPMTFRYRSSAAKFSLAKRSMQLAVNGGGGFSAVGKSFVLTDVVFRTPSEHTVFGEHYPMEVQLFHKGPEGREAAVSLLVKGGSHNPALDPVWQRMSHEDKRAEAVEAFNMTNLLPASGQYYSYAGSHTTPPCKEGVEWFVMKAPIEASVEQLQAIAAIVGKNARPTQAVAKRKFSLKGYSITEQNQAGMAH